MRRLLFVLLAALPLFAQSEIAPGIRLVRGKFVPGTQPDGNSVIFRVADGYVVVDTGRHVEHTRTVLDAARPLVAVVNTHWHLDHIGGNAIVRRESPDTKIYASDALAGAREGFLANYRKQLVEMNDPKYQPEIDLIDAEQGESSACIDAGPKLMPDVVIKESGMRTIGGREFYVGLEQAATKGDVWLLDKESGVLVAGDLVTLPVPFLDTACPARWKESLDRLAKTDFELLVPGHGPPLTRRQFNVYRTAFAQLLACKEGCGDAWVDAVAPLIPKEEQPFARELMKYYAELAKKTCS